MGLTRVSGIVAYNHVGGVHAAILGCCGIKVVIAELDIEFAGCRLVYPMVNAVVVVIVIVIGGNES